MFSKFAHDNALEKAPNDPHKGYDSLDKPNLHLLGCMMHARRRFNDVYLSAGKKPGLAENAIKIFKRLYKFEEAYKQQGLTPEQRFEARQKEVKPYGSSARTPR